MKKYQTIEVEVKKIEEEIRNHEANLQETEARIESYKETIKTISQRFQDAVYSGDEKTIREVEREATQAQAALKRDEALLVAIKEKLVELKAKLSKAQEEKERVFSELAAKWLGQEIKAFDKAAQEMRQAIRRLLAAHHILRDAGYQDVYRETVGEGYVVIPSSRIPILSEFDPSIYRYYPYNQVTGEILKTVQKEIIG